MASVTSMGLGSGLDVNSIITQLMSIEKQPLTTLQKTESSINGKISSFGKIQSALSTLQDKASAFGSTSLWGRTSTTVSDASVATVTSVAGQKGVAGSYSLQVDQLASAQTTSTAVFTGASPALSEGTLTIELGTWTGSGATPTGFTAKSGSSPVSIAIGSGETSLTSIRDKINSANAGVTAGIVTDATGSRLTLRSKATGEANAFRISVTETADDGVQSTGLSALAFDAATAVSGQPSAMTLHQSAKNAKAQVNGIAVQSSTNTLDGVLEGMSIKLNKTTASPVDMTVTADNTDLKTAVNDFITAFNSLADTVKSETKYDATTKAAGKLQSDRTAVGVQTQMRAVLYQNYQGSDSGDYKRLSDIGVSIDSSGKLQLKSSKLDDALAADPEKVKAMLYGGGSVSAGGNLGVMKNFRKMADTLLDSDGPLETRTQSLKNTLKVNQKQQDDLQTRLDATETRLKKQYQALDDRMGKLSSLSNSVSLMISNYYR